MTEPRPRLVAVDGEPTPEVAPAQPAAGRRRSLGELLPWLLAGVAVVCALGWSFSAQRARQFEASLHASNAALLEARAQLDSYDSHLLSARDQAGQLVREAGAVAERIQAQLAALGAELGELEAFLSEGPAVPEAE